MTLSLAHHALRGRRSTLLVLTFAAALVLGYHPAAEDGGIYSAALLLRIQPQLFPHSREFVAAHMHYSFFIPLIAALHHIVPLSLWWYLFVLHVSSIFLLLVGAQQVLRAASFSLRAQRGALFVLALGMGLPVAGTALYIADPYFTARSLSAPLLLFTLARVLEKRWQSATLFFLVAVAIHPLMAIWGGLLILSIAAAYSPAPKVWIPVLCVALFACYAAVYRLAPVENTTMQTLAQTRNYWYLSQWCWYEVIGAIAPPLLLLFLFLDKKTFARSIPMLWGLVLSFALPVALALVFVHPGSSVLLPARMQPLRTLQLDYVLFLICLGAWLGNHLLKASSSRYLVASLVIAAPLFAMQRSLYAASNPWEMPWMTPINPWSRAFLWVRSNTSPSDYFALDAHYVGDAQEDAESFRALSERSALPDMAKDGGVASVSNALADAWLQGTKATLHLNTLPDAERIQHLAPYGVSWIVLPMESSTSFACPYTNEVVKICKMPKPATQQGLFARSR